MITTKTQPASLDALIKFRDQLRAKIDRLQRERDDLLLEMDEAARKIEFLNTAIDAETLLKGVSVQEVATVA